MRCRRSALTAPFRAKARDADAVETPAARATSRKVTSGGGRVKNETDYRTRSLKAIAAIDCCSNHSSRSPLKAQDPLPTTRASFGRPSGGRETSGDELRAEVAAHCSERTRLLGPEPRQQLVVRREFALPKLPFHAHYLAEAIGAEIQAAPLEVTVFGLHAQCGFDAVPALVTAIDDPFEHPHVLTEARPCELPVRVGV